MDPSLAGEFDATRRSMNHRKPTSPYPRLSNVCAQRHCHRVLIDPVSRRCTVNEDPCCAERRERLSLSRNFFFVAVLSASRDKWENVFFFFSFPAAFAAWSLQAKETHACRDVSPREQRPSALHFMHAESARRHPSQRVANSARALYVCATIYPTPPSRTNTGKHDSGAGQFRNRRGRRIAVSDFYRS